MKNDNTPHRLAVLIDADNVSASVLDGLLAEVAKYGVAIIKRIYGDWTTPNLGSWKPKLLEHSIQPIQQFRYTTGKNATDSALIIDAMDLLYGGKLDAFCLVSSDSDFTRLASRIREHGLTVYGFGERKTPRAFITACDKFVFTDILGTPPPSEAKAEPKKKGIADPALLAMLRQAVDDVADDSGWAHLGGVGSQISARQPDFDPRNYGFGKLAQLFEAAEAFELARRQQPNGQTVVQVRHAQEAHKGAARKTARKRGGTKGA
jgi:uncharacterized LabA/DUF88 family protein